MIALNRIALKRLALNRHPPECTFKAGAAMQEMFSQRCSLLHTCTSVVVTSRCQKNHLMER